MPMSIKQVELYLEEVMDVDECKIGVELYLVLRYGSE